MSYLVFNPYQHVKSVLNYKILIKSRCKEMLRSYFYFTNSHRISNRISESNDDSIFGETMARGNITWFVIKK